MFARTFFAPRYFGGRYYFSGQTPSGYFAPVYFAPRYFAGRYFAPAGIPGGYFPHNYFAGRYYPTWYYCPATARSSLIGLQIIEKPRVLFAPSRYIDWWVLCKPSVSFTPTTFHRIRWEVVESPFVEFEPTTVAKHGEFNIIEKPHVEFTATIGKSGECISADGRTGFPEVLNAVY